MSTRENIRLIARTPLGFVIMSTRENIRLIARAPLQNPLNIQFAYCPIASEWPTFAILSAIGLSQIIRPREY